MAIAATTPSRLADGFAGPNGSDVLTCHNRQVFCPNAVVGGDVATWLAGVATVATLFFGVYQWVKLRRHSLADQKTRLEQERRGASTTHLRMAGWDGRLWSRSSR